MGHQQEMIEGLLKSLKIIEEEEKRTTNTMGRLLAESDYRKQLFVWIGQVSSSLEAAGMVEELGIWDRATSDGIDSSAFSSLSSQINALRSILIGLLERLNRVQPVGTLFPIELVQGTKSYIEKIANQANGCYEQGWYDASAVMLRRLIETLIIECYEKHNITSKILDKGGNYLRLDDLINSFVNETAWHVPRTMRKYLPTLKELKTLCDTSAHDRYFMATRGQLDKLSQAIGFTIQGLIQIAGLE